MGGGIDSVMNQLEVSVDGDNVGIIGDMVPMGAFDDDQDE